ncbi:MAG: multidrug ABC transporter ATP-binding protein [Gemmatimonas sp. SG8_38_2]|nr:MAG: multidrug ABC transporter ATP-binding protein [Gemmatimonas sp. SG8_38_2]
MREGVEVAVRCNGLRKRYGDVIAVDGLDLEVLAGECFGLLGPNGAGKTTTVEILEGLLQPDAGELEVLGMRWGKDDHALRQRLGVQLQETQLAEKLTVEETLRLFRSFFDQGRDPDEVMQIVGLEEKRGSWVSKLSGGQQQRLAVASALVSRPDLLFLDEPTTGLDPQSRRQLWDLVLDFKAAGGTVLLTTHYMEEAHRLCDRVAVVDHGRVIALGTPSQLIAALGAEHVVEIDIDEDDLTVDSWLRDVEGVQDVRHEREGIFLTVSEVHKTVPALLTALEAHEVELSRLTTHNATLEDVFVSLTGRRLRDE